VCVDRLFSIWAIVFRSQFHTACFVSA
jgi:hypothetical protein